MFEFKIYTGMNWDMHWDQAGGKCIGRNSKRAQLLADLHHF